MRVEITVSMDPFVNPAIDRTLTGSSIIREITVVNNGEAIVDGHLKVVTVPFITELSTPVDVSIPGGGTVVVDVSESMDVNPLHLLELSDLYISKLKVVLYTGDNDVVAESDVYNVRLLTCNTWPGCPDKDILSAFVVPSQPSVIDHVASLRRPSVNRSIEDTVTSIVRVLCKRRMSKTNVPGNLFKRPHRFVMYEEMSSTKACTSLDMALAFSAMAEAVGLDPVICVFARGFMTGVIGPNGKGWDSIIPVDPELLFGGCPPEEVVTMSRSSDKGALDTMVDVASLRKRVRPIPYRLMEHGMRTYVPVGEIGGCELPLRYIGWMSRLLDMSLNNSLLSMGSKVVRMDMGSQEAVSMLQDSLIIGNEFRTRFADAGGDVLGWILDNRLPIDPVYRDVMDSIRRDINVNIRETGAGGGSIGLGVVSWKDTKGRMHDAPLVLVSVDMRKLNNHSYALNHPDMEDAMVNIVLIERLKRDVGLKMPPSEGFVSEGRVDMGRLIPYITCLPDVVYSPMAVFGEFGLETNAMWNDLGSNSDTILSHPLVRRLSRGEQLDTMGFLEPEYDMTDLHPILPVDSTQIAAINAAVSGRSFVIKGPPGTGKSQTICNMICELLYRGRTVLFVSQKASALDVIHRKLSSIGIGVHCMGAYGKRARRSSVIDQLRNIVEVCHDHGDIDDFIPHVVDTDALDRYYEAMFSGQRGEESFYRMYNRYLSSQTMQNVLSEPGPDAMKAFGKDVESLDALISGIPSDDLLSMFPPSDFSSAMLTGEVRVNASAMRRASESCVTLCELLRRCGLGGEMTIDEVRSLAVDLMDLKSVGLKPSDLDAVRARIQRAWGLHGSVQGLDEHMQTLGLYSDRDGLLKALGIMRDILSDNDIQGLGSDDIPCMVESIDDKMARIQALSPDGTWGELVTGLNAESVRIAEDIRQSGNDPDEFCDILHQALTFLNESFPGMGTNPFRVSDLIHDYEKLSRSWNLDIPVNEFRESILSLKGLIHHIDSIIDGIKATTSGWGQCDQAVHEYVSFNERFSEISGNRVLSSMFFIDDLRQCYGSLLRSVILYNSSLMKSHAVWYPTVYASVEESMRLLDMLEDRRILNRINGGFSDFMRRVEPHSRNRIKLGEVREKLQLARDTRHRREEVDACIKRCDKACSDLIDAMFRLEVLSIDVEELQDSIPDWEVYRQDGSLSHSDLNVKADSLCKSIRSILKGMGVSSRNMVSTDFEQLSVLCDHIMSEKEVSDRYAEIHEGCLILASSLPGTIEDAIERIRVLEDTISRTHPESTGIPMGCTLMLMDHSDEIASSVSSCRAMLEPYDSIMCDALGSDALNISELSDRLALMGPHLRAIQGLQRFTSSLIDGGDAFLRSMVDVLGRYPRDVIVASLESWFLRNILDIRIGEAFGIQDYGRGMLPDYEERVRDSYDAMYRHNREDLAHLLKKRAADAVSDPSLAVLSSKDIPLSQVLDSISHIIHRLAPCFIMNVQSVSRFLGNSSITFDYVIFDESSQIPLADSISSLSKGDACIMVGDTNQLPPTGFFRNSTGEQSEGETESVLEELIFKGMPSLELEWHYRSNHESLIAYSNSRFYDNRLITFPSVSDRVSMVDFRYVEDGVYMRGEGRNPVEAAAVVDEVYRICSDPSYSGESIGVVTFGSSQKEEVERQLTERMDTDPLPYTNRREPLFVGNLESIQGEERSIILLSVGYGRDIDGRISMNFGPLNQGRGWRRLNVAISRARDRMTVFSSMRPSDIRVGERTGRGVRELRGFLEYAESGSFERKVSSADIIDPILPDVARVVEDMGYHTDLNIGKSELRIDVAVVDPNVPERYCLAILLDRNLHDNSRNPVDRDYTKVCFLRKMGWKVLRVHTIDWMMDREATVERIRQSLP